MVFRCDLCRIDVPDEHVLADHTKGKRHQALLIARQRFETSQHSSIYISRIKPEHNEEVLKNYFAQFGTIKNCFVDKEKHVYAIVEYAQEESAKKCLANSDEHQLPDGNRLKVKQRREQEFKSKRMLISEEEFLNLNKEKEIEHHAALLERLNDQLTIDDQANALLQLEIIQDDRVKIREEFFQELQTMFKQYFSDSQLVLIGSMGNGLATNLSDMDLVLVLNDTYVEAQRNVSANSSAESMHIDENSLSNDVEMNSARKVLNRNTSDESTTHSLSPATCSAEDLLQMSIADRFDHIRRLLRSYAAHVCHVQRILQARCPVLRFCHKQEKIFCELSINNHLAVANTELVRYFLALEPKLRPLLFTLRLWMKQKDLLGKGHRFNTYTLFWMIVVSMQLNQRQLPSVQSLAESEVERKRQHGPWNCSVPDTNSIVPRHSSSSIEQILNQFFTFYSTFNASQNELSPWTGDLQSKTATVPNKDIPFSLFDPFEHDHNLTSNVSPANWSKFQEECLLAHQILLEAARKRQHKAWGLSLILTRKSLPLKNFHHDQPSRTHPHHQTIEWTCHRMNEHELEEKIHYIFKDILFFQSVDPDSIRKKRPASPTEHSQVTPNALAEQLDETLSNKRRRLNDDGFSLTPISDSDSNTTVSVKDKIFFQIAYRTWQDRRKIKRNIDHENTTTPIFEREQLISMKLKEEKDHQLKTPLHLAMEMKFISSINDQKVQIHLEHLSHEQHQLFMDLTHFLNLYLPKMLTNSSKTSP